MQRPTPALNRSLRPRTRHTPIGSMYVRKRKVAQELVDTERDYISSLRALLNVRIPMPALLLDNRTDIAASTCTHAPTRSLSA